MSLQWLWLIIPPPYLLLWYVWARINCRLDAREAKRKNKEMKHEDIVFNFWISALWPLSMWLTLAWGAHVEIIPHLERTALPKRERPLPDLREIEGKYPK